MDKAAKDALTTIATRPTPAIILIFPQQRIFLHLSGLPIVGDIHYQIQQHRYGHDLEARIKSTLPPQAPLHSIDWTGLETAFCGLSQREKYQE